MNNIDEIVKKINRTVNTDKIILMADTDICCGESDKLVHLVMPQKLKYDSEIYFDLKGDILNMGDEVFLITLKKYLYIVNRLMWECRNVKGVACLDSSDPYEIEEKVTKKDILLWDVQASRAPKDDQAFMSGWNNSYNNAPFTKEEIDEYVENNYIKLKPYLGPDKDLLEVGIGSGMMAFKMYDMCRNYDGSDISSVVLSWLSDSIKKSDIANIHLYQCSADQVNKIDKKYDIIFMSSVTEYFSGYNYLRQVVVNCIDSLKDNGILFFADVFDLNKKEIYRNSINHYAKEHPGCRFKKDFSHELFVPKEYWIDLYHQLNEIADVSVTDKIGNHVNEINLFRYDVMLHIRKKTSQLTKIQIANQTEADE